MQAVEYKEPDSGRWYTAFQDGDELMLIGPPEGLVDTLELPPAVATNLHNVLYRRRIFTFADASRRGVLVGALQEALNIDAQRLSEAFMKFEKQEVVP
jgi:hypothetical protein